MSRVEWSRRGAEEVEELLGILLCSKFGLAATRVRPSRGDKGIDVYVLTSDGWVVFQIKSFTTSLTSSQRRQITDSWTTFSTYAQEEGIEVKAWYLLRPLNPTTEDEAWLETLTAGAGYTCRWLGLDYCETLVADHPAVVDYFLFDGKDRLDNTIQQYLALVGFQRHEGQDRTFDLEPADSLDVLGSVHGALNAFDPFYRYDFAVNDVSGGLPAADVSAHSPPGLVASVTSSDGKRAVTFHIFERFKDSALERPIPGNISLAIEPGTAEAEAWADFVKFGLPVADLPLRTASVDLPGGLGLTDATNATAWIGPAHRSGESTPDLILRVSDPDGMQLAEVLVRTELASVGLTGEGIAIRGTEAGEVFTIVVKGEVNGPSHFNLRMTGVSGAVPGAVTEGLRFLHHFRPPNRFEAWIAHGPRLSPLQDISDGVGDPRDLLELVLISEALAEIQRHASQQIRIPANVTSEEAHEWLVVAALLRGETVGGTWSDMPVELHPEAAIPGDTSGQFQIMATVPLAVSVSDLEIELGRRQIVCKTARVDPGSVTGNRIRLVPGDDNSMTSRWLPDSEDTAN
jgi:hypothetical protein